MGWGASLDAAVSKGSSALDPRRDGGAGRSAPEPLAPEETITNLVVMGMGESLANLDNLVAALDRICSPEGLGLGQRR